MKVYIIFFLWLIMYIMDDELDISLTKHVDVQNLVKYLLSINIV